jgi:phosphoglycolate phosphatase-like HAD superfamily hydrolase
MALKNLWDVQAEQQRELGLDPAALSPLERRNVARDLLLSLHEEVSELQRQSGQSYKRHILAGDASDRHNVAIEVADALKLLFAVAQLHGLTEAEVTEAFLDKTRVVKARHEGELARIRSEPVLCVDVDDVLADLGAWHLELNAIKGADSPGAERHRREEAWKDEWYRSGRFRDIPPVEGAAEAMAAVRGWGWRVVLVTARPQWQYKRIHADTLHWLSKHGIHHDLILFGKDKVELVHEHLAPAWPVAFVEDHDRNARALSAAGIRVLLYDRAHNRHLPDGPNLERVGSWPEILERLSKCR